MRVIASVFQIMSTYHRPWHEILTCTWILEGHDMESDHDVVIDEKQGPIGTTKCGLDRNLALDTRKATP